jgi:hypothetical protein
MLLFEYFSGKNHHIEKRFSLLSAEPMFYIQMPTGEAAPVFDYKTFPFEIFVDAPKIHKKGKSRDRVQYYNLVTAFDIETTTILTDEPYAFMYQWQYCIEDYVFMGKTWNEFQDFINILSSKLNLYIKLADNDLIIGTSLVTYVHNLSYEFQFMRYFIGDLVHPLVTDKYAPLLIPTKKGITFRCSYRLTNKTLEKFTKGCEHAKLAGDLDYSIIRTPKSKMTDTELAYCYNDVKGLCEALRDRLEKDKHYNIASIPLTSTGYVRKDCQKSMNSNSQNRGNFQRSKLTPELYRLLRAAFRGGNTHANAAYTGKLIGIPCGRYIVHKDNTSLYPRMVPFGGNIKHYDIASSYPSSILINTFPMGPFLRCQELEGRYLNKDIKPLMNKFISLCRANCILLKVRMIDIKYRGSCGVPYIPISKTMYRTMDAGEIVEDNGRIYSAPLIETVLTDIDFKITMRDYDVGALEIVEAYTSWRGKLPAELRSVVLDYYKRKTLLKHADSPEDQYEYAKAKEYLNSTYGMMVMRIDRLEFEYVDNEYKQIEKSLQEQIDTYYESRSNCLPYQWGVWVTANSRARLQAGMDICGKDLLYVDTDSVFYIGDHEAEFEALNSKLRQQAEQAGAVAENRAGESFPIGLWDREKDSMLFMTLGAKKYILSTDGEHLETTIAGVSKKLGAEYFTEHGFEAFKDDTIIRDSGKIAAIYNNEPPHYIEVNGEKILTASNIAMIPSAYTVHITDKYGRFIEMIRQSLYI